MIESERAVTELLGRGPISGERASSYRNTLNALVSAKIARRTPDGGYELARDAAVTRVPRTEPPQSTRDATLTVDLPEDCIAILDRMGGTRDAAICNTLRPYLGSGVWRKR